MLQFPWMSQQAQPEPLCKHACRTKPDCKHKCCKRARALKSPAAGGRGRRGGRGGGEEHEDRHGGEGQGGSRTPERTPGPIGPGSVSTEGRRNGGGGGATTPGGRQSLEPEFDTVAPQKDRLAKQVLGPNASVASRVAQLPRGAGLVVTADWLCQVHARCSQSLRETGGRGSGLLLQLVAAKADDAEVSRLADEFSQSTAEGAWTAFVEAVFHHLGGDDARDLLEGSATAPEILGRKETVAQLVRRCREAVSAWRFYKSTVLKQPSSEQEDGDVKRALTAALPSRWKTQLQAGGSSLKESLPNLIMRLKAVERLLSDDRERSEGSKGSRDTERRGRGRSRSPKREGSRERDRRRSSSPESLRVLVAKLARDAEKDRQEAQRERRDLRRDFVDFRDRQREERRRGDDDRGRRYDRGGNGARDGRGLLCYQCNSTDHLARNCPRGVVCFNCHQQGHVSKNCPQKQDGERRDPPGDAALPRPPEGPPPGAVGGQSSAQQSQPARPAPLLQNASFHSPRAGRAGQWNQGRR